MGQVADTFQSHAFGQSTKTHNSHHPVRSDSTLMLHIPVRLTLSAPSILLYPRPLLLPGGDPETRVLIFSYSGFDWMDPLPLPIFLQFPLTAWWTHVKGSWHWAAACFWSLLRSSEDPSKGPE